MYFTVFSPNTGKYGPEKTPYVDTFHTVTPLGNYFWTKKSWNIIDLKLQDLFENAAKYPTNTARVFHVLNDVEYTWCIWSVAAEAY